MVWVPDIDGRRGALYASIADALEEDLASGRVAPGERLPTHRELARRLDLNVTTISRAYAEAARRGLVDGEVGRGTFVRSRGPTFDRSATLETERVEIDFGLNLPAGDLAGLSLAVLEGEDMAERRRELLEGFEVQGRADHREAAALWLGARGLAADPERVLITGGAQHAITVTLSTLTVAGDLIATEELTYSGLRSQASILHLRLVGLPTDDEGLIPEGFEDLCRKTPPKALYTTPTLQNPLGVVMSTARREAIASIARRHRVAIIEDDATGVLHPKPPPPLSSFAPEISTFIGSASKLLAPGLRIGFLLAPRTGGGRPVAVERLMATMSGISWNASPLTAELALRWLGDGSAHALLKNKQVELAARRRLFDERFGDLLCRSDPASPHVWMQLPNPWRTDDFVSQARQRGVAVTGSEAFVVGRAMAPHAIRICLSTPRTRAEADRGLALLARVLDGRPDSGAAIV